MDTQTMTFLPQISMRPIWDERAGLIVSPFGHPLPLEVAQETPKRYIDYLVPRLVADRDIYTAFYPKEPISKGAFLGVLDVSDQELKDLVVGGGERWRLEEKTRKAWETVETIMIQMYTKLLNHHEQHAFLPPIAIPDPPKSLGYCDTFTTHKEATDAAKRSLRRFPLLSAVCTFALSLWLNPYREQAFDAAFALLERYGFGQTVLQHIKDSPICDLSPHLRPGCFLDANNTDWGRIIYRIGRAGIPLWVIWGLQYNSGPAASSTMDRYFRPPESIVDRLRCRNDRAFPLAPLPRKPDVNVAIGGSTPYQPSTPADNRQHARKDAKVEFNDDEYTPYDGFLEEGEIPSAPKAVVPGSRQREGETWEEFRRRLEESREHALQSQLRATMEDRDLRAACANEGKESMGRHSKAFYWAKDSYHHGYYIRTPMDHADDYWCRYTKFQRFYWSQVDEWDLVDHIPRYPDHIPPEERIKVEDPDDLPLPMYNKTSSKPPAEVASEKLRRATDCFLEGIRRQAERKARAVQFQPHFLDFIFYVRLRHGFNVQALHNQSSYLWGNLKLDINKSAAVYKRLNFADEAPEDDPHAVPVIDFHNTTIAVPGGKSIVFADFPPNWDFTPSFESDSRAFILLQIVKASPFQEYAFQQERVTVQHAREHDSEKRAPLYILRPSPKNKDRSSWFVATTDPTTVLFIFRLGLTSMAAIASKLLEHGIPFRTVEERRSHGQLLPLAPPDSQAYLSRRPEGWNPTKDDYLAYLEGRENVFRSYLGRSLKARGGIVGRMAAEVVLDVEVLSGPVRGDEVVGISRDGFYFVDDYISNEVWDIVAGMYRIRATGQGALGTMKKCSWWPTQERYMGSGVCGDHWTPAAESWYQRRLKVLKEGNIKWKDGKGWKIAIQWDRKQSTLLEGSRTLAAKFISEVLHPSYKWSSSRS